MGHDPVAHVLTPGSGTRLLLGNEAIVRGALEAGLDFAAAYPGTPASEIGDLLAQVSARGGPRFEWAVNEKVAFEMAAAAAASGLRALTAMKHVGLNVAADPLMTSAYTGTVGGFVIVSADDPSCHSSQNEQDNRLYARLASLPMLEPSTPQEALEMTRAAFSLSEALSLPVLLRTTTRVSHTRAAVVLTAPPPARREGRRGRFVRDPLRWVTVPDVARRARRVLLDRLGEAERAAELSVFNRMTLLESPQAPAGAPTLGVVGSGVARGYVREALEQRLARLPLRVLLVELGFTYPVPRSLLRRLLERVERVLVVEEVEPLLEHEVLALAGSMGRRVRVFGRDSGHLPRCHELGPETVEQALEAALEDLPGPAPRGAGARAQGAPGAAAGAAAVRVAGAAGDGVPVPPRPPVLCPGCPHRHTYYAARRAVRVAARRLGAGAEPVFPTDIGCYSLGVARPYEMADYLLCMGSSVGSACGFAACTDQVVVAFIGDSTFFHAGMPALAQAVHQGRPFTLVVMDNRTTAMTGHQPHPGAGAGRPGAGTVEIPIENVARGLGVPWVRVVDPSDLRATQQAIQEAILSGGPAVVVARAPCILLEVAARRRRGEPVTPYAVDPERCTACMACVRQFACPAITAEDGRVAIDPDWCNGCGVCPQVCPKDAIHPSAAPRGGETGAGA